MNILLLYVRNSISNVGTYIVNYDYIAKTSDELTIRKGDIITDVVQSDDGWLKGKCQGKIGYFPDTNVTLVDKEKANKRTFITINTGKKNEITQKRSLIHNNTSSQNSTLFQVKALYTYQSMQDDELSIKPNDIINVTQLIEKGWYEGILNGKIGFFPSNYVIRINEDNSKTNQVIKQKSINGHHTPVQHEISKKTSLIKARVLHDYEAEAKDELTLKTNDIVTILDKNLDDEGWWKGELNGRIGIFPDNCVEEISELTNSKHRPKTPEIGARHPSQALSKRKSNNDDSSHNLSNEPQHTTKSRSVSFKDDDSKQDHYREVKNLDSEEKLSDIDKQTSILRNRQLSAIGRKNENGLIRTTGSLDETIRSQSVDLKSENKMHTPTPPSYQREPGQVESPRYANRSYSITSTNNSTLINTNESRDSLSGSTTTTTITLEQLKKDLMQIKLTMNEMKLKFTDQIQDLIHELDEEKKARATLQIEIERLQKLVQKSSRLN
ncbi:unnamed protein product [Rotaria sp. Silwood1]|nr:unnamed protein product [Rotaria sp. Silwood1]CAF3587353.1 unnamed protein product [Rotaria sp. Silwood1]